MAKPLCVVGAVVSDHDSAVALVVDGRLVAAINEERLCRVRRGDPRNSVRRALNYVLAEAGLTPADIDLVACDTAYYYPPGGHPPIAVFPDFPDEKIVLLDHHLGHAASAFLPSPFDEAAVLTVDASGGVAPLTADRRRWGFRPADLAFRDRGFRAAHRHPTVAELLRAHPEAEARNYPAESLTLGHAVRGERFVEIEDQMAGGSLGYFYAICAHFLGMEEGSFMGLAAHGGPNKFDELFRQILRIESDGRLTLDPDWLRFWADDRVLEDPVSFKRLAPRWFETFGQPRRPDDDISPRDKDFAWSAQHRLEEALAHIATRLRQLTGSPNLCLAGGVALNSVANGKLIARAGFERVFIQPAASDDGIALGFALFADYVLAGVPAKKRWTMTDAATGRTYPEADIADFFARLQSGRLPLEYLAAIPGTRRVDVVWSIGGGAPQRTAMAYDEPARRWRAELPVPVGAAVEYSFESFGDPIETYLLAEPPSAPAPAAEKTDLPAEFRKFLDDHRDLAGALDGERAFIGPEHVVIDPTNRCNNNCLPCWTNSPLLGDFGPPASWARQEMPAEMLLRLIDELATLGAKRLRFTGGGEPLLHPAIFPAIERAKARGLICALTTNFSVIDDAGVRRLAAAGLDELTVSLWAGSAAIYSRSHPNKTEKTFAEIERHLRLYAECKRPGAEIVMANVLFSMNFMESREMLDFALRVGADGLYFALVDSVHPRTDGLLLAPPQLRILRQHLGDVRRRVDEVRAAGRLFRLDNWDGLLARVEAAGAPRGDYDQAAVEAIPCYVGWMFARVLPTGEVAPCCRGVNKPLGDLRRKSFAEIWHGEKAREFRRMALRESKRHPYFAAIGCRRVCDNLMHNGEFHARMQRLTAEERAQLRRFIVDVEPAGPAR
jgi:MoaA/NifB/PqqE/SkfB family radical SAM enzyme